MEMRIVDQYSFVDDYGATRCKGKQAEHEQFGLLVDNILKWKCVEYRKRAHSISRYQGQKTILFESNKH
jgi:hypothetical protein